MMSLSKVVNSRRGALAAALLVTGFFGSTGNVQAEDRAAAFAQCIAGLQRQAQERGLGAPLIAALGRANNLQRVVELDRSQPEFTQTFADYFNRRVTDFRVERGRELLREYGGLLQDLTREYGVPSQYLLAFWGLETNFGNYLGKIPTLDSLATLACDPRRSSFFTTELFHALDLVEQHELELDNMQGSWAGAIGHTQFMPSAYRSYGVDGDGDGRVDLWNSIPDALTSAANFLKSLGWERALRWGREVQLPKDFPYHDTGLNNRKPLREWQELGVRRVNGDPVGHLDLEAALLVPSGADGPKFLVYDNFDVIMRWNRSQFYALSVGHLADRINGAGELNQKPPTSRGLAVSEVEGLQNVLKDRGFDPGEVDGQLGPATARAIRAYQHSAGKVADGFADQELLEALGVPLHKGG
ncbi:lytic murein transglycosylase [Gilvimarinus sp. F26214L]|uniref:lytic murein transglycosylase n=1 Tax=Gilvimarinus sp. DZF01 TaxID=3461371 RepID=UPI0040454EFD